MNLIITKTTIVLFLAIAMANFVAARNEVGSSGMRRKLKPDSSKSKSSKPETSKPETSKNSKSSKSDAVEVAPPTDAPIDAPVEAPVDAPPTDAPTDAPVEAPVDALPTDAPTDATTWRKNDCHRRPATDIDYVYFGCVLPGRTGSVCKSCVPYDGRKCPGNKWPTTEGCRTYHDADECCGTVHILDGPPVDPPTNAPTPVDAPVEAPPVEAPARDYDCADAKNEFWYKYCAFGYCGWYSCIAYDGESCPTGYYQDGAGLDCPIPDVDFCCV